MPNASNLARRKPGSKILILGNTGAGKTTQFLTLPGKKFMYLFDPNAVLSIQGHDVDYEEFLPDNLDLGLTSLTKGKGDVKSSMDGAKLYRSWEDNITEKIESGFFNAYDAIALDSFTTLSDMVMDGVLGINNRSGQWPQQDDYGPQMLTLTKIVRTLTSLNKCIYVTGHVEMKQDEVTKRIFQTPLMTGRLKAKLPLLFSEIFYAEAQTGRNNKVIYTLQTKPDRTNPIIRTTIMGTEVFEDVTLDLSKSLIGQGLGGLISRGETYAKKVEGINRSTIKSTEA